MKLKILEFDQSLAAFEQDLNLRMENYNRKRNELLLPWQTLADFANGHTFYGFHKSADGWTYREWAPAADAMYLTGDFCNWERHACPMKKVGDNFEVFLPGADALKHGQQVMAIVVKDGREMDRIPLYATRGTHR